MSTETVAVTETSAPAVAGVVETPNKATETAPEAPVMPEKVTSAKLLDIARKEAEWAKKEVARKQELADKEAKLSQYEKELSELKAIKEKYRDNPDEALSKLGLTYEELTDAYLQYQQKAHTDPEIKSIREEIDTRFKQREEEEQKRLEQQMLEEQEAIIGEFRKEVNGFVTSNAEKYPLMTKLHRTLGEAESPEDIIMGAMQEHYEATGELLSYEKVADTAEEWFREEFNKLTGTPVKVQESKPQAEERREETKSIDFSRFKEAEYATPNSITNAMSKPTTRVDIDPKRVVREDAVQRALRAWEMEEKKMIRK